MVFHTARRILPKPMSTPATSASAEYHSLVTVGWRAHASGRFDRRRPKCLEGVEIEMLRCERADLCTHDDRRLHAISQARYLKPADLGQSGLRLVLLHGIDERVCLDSPIIAKAGTWVNGGMVRRQGSCICADHY